MAPRCPGERGFVQKAQEKAVNFKEIKTIDSKKDLGQDTDSMADTEGPWNMRVQGGAEEGQQVNSTAYLSDGSQIGTCTLNKPTPAFIINLKRRPDRWAKTKAWTSLVTQCITPYREEATDGSVSMIDESLVAKEWDVRLNGEMVKAGNGQGYNPAWTMLKSTPGELGCGMSHAKLWHRVARSAEPVLILEDDIGYIPGFQMLFS